MLRNAKTLEGYELHARDGEIGRVNDIYFDDADWHLRYFVVDTGSWLTGRTVLITPAALSVRDWDSGRLRADLTKEQVRNSPSVDIAKPVSRQHEQALYDYYTWPYYWGPGAAGAAVGYGLATTPLPMAERSDNPAKHRQRDASKSEGGITEGGSSAQDDPHLRSVRAVRGYHIGATDKSIGHVEDLVIDDDTWTVRCLVVDTRNWWPGKKVILTLSQIQGINWMENKVHVNTTSEAIKEAPEFQGTRPLVTDYLDRLDAHYRKSPTTASSANLR